MEVFEIKRVKSVIITALPFCFYPYHVCLGYNLWSSVQPLGEGSTILDMYDFVLSKNILPFGAMCYILYVSLKRGWGFDNYLPRINTARALNSHIS
ncbi:hypothetical protein [Anaerobiospirillum thomasii]|uniref:Uncharacterized protein n=1 Tax=Anaerobiospirillum thomasii TaxID=179995 RepID=A0A2X0W0A0_9GAMM|nr:hypothetical protein [Anaerobiospirillum thomasii]SPT78966.1 Uncharacterised protein [Anaerobiospirillum thomasii]